MSLVRGLEICALNPKPIVSLRCEASGRVEVEEVDCLIRDPVCGLAWVRLSGHYT